MLDYTHNTYTIHSIYKFNGNGDSGAASYWRVLKHNGVTYLCADQAAILVDRLDTVNWQLIPVVSSTWGTDQGGYQYASLWTDGSAGGACNGIIDPGEQITYNWINWSALLPSQCMQVDDNFNYYYVSEGTTPRIVKVPVTGWTQDCNGDNWAPIYPNLQTNDAVTFANFPSDCINSDGTVNPANDNLFTFSDDGSVYVNKNLNMATWGQMADVREIKWDASGNCCWEVGQLNAGTWKANTSYSAGQIVYPTYNPSINCYECTGAGTSSGSEPTWIVPQSNPPQYYPTVTDGSVTWTFETSAYTVADSNHTCNPGQIWDAFRTRRRCHPRMHHCDGL